MGGAAKTAATANAVAVRMFFGMLFTLSTFHTELRGLLLQAAKRNHFHFLLCSIIGSRLLVLRVVNNLGLLSNYKYRLTLLLVSTVPYGINLDLHTCHLEKSILVGYVSPPLS